MLSENYAKLDDLAGPDSFVTPPSQTDLAYILHFQKICKRYNIDFATAEVEGCEQNIGPTSTFCNCFVADCLVLETCKYLVSKGYTPPVFRSGNMPGGDEYNQSLVNQYHGKSILLF